MGVTKPRAGVYDALDPPLYPRLSQRSSVANDSGSHMSNIICKYNELNCSDF